MKLNIPSKFYLTPADQLELKRYLISQRSRILCDQSEKNLKDENACGMQGLTKEEVSDENLCKILDCLAYTW